MGRVYSSFEVKSEVYSRLKEAYGEEVVRADWKYKVPHRRASIFDIVILGEGDQLRLIIDVKKNALGAMPTKASYYTWLTGGIPAICLRGMGEARQAVEIVQDFFELHERKTHPQPEDQE